MAKSKELKNRLETTLAGGNVIRQISDAKSRDIAEVQRRIEDYIRFYNEERIQATVLNRSQLV
ncbi:IS3 family transposase [Paenibacillus sp. LMG 31456]|uniref:IS3 family transposase n=1 Tax=Paenibacillus foliorum TaxID=2654974 RepID=A0A972GKP7_9BACL|nr:IS3 family transposase [Paenibacillus foliorum]NOU92546.1 IS3 family transposase [Paenibacillus foliorum]